MDYVFVINEKNEKEKMEVVSLFNMSNSDYNYIIYKPINIKNYYVAKYKGDEIADLNTDLSGKEFMYANSILNSLVED